MRRCYCSAYSQQHVHLQQWHILRLAAGALRQASKEGIFWSFIQCEFLLCMQATSSAKNAQKKKEKAPFDEKVSLS